MPQPSISDSRHIANGWEIPSENYSDQPYVLKTADGAWLAVMTTGQGHEGKPGQHVVTLRSTDLGRTWAAPVDVEPADGPEASYAVLLRVPGGRIYCFYAYNSERIEHGDLPCRQPGFHLRRADMFGHFVLKFSDDHGRSWSPERTEVPVREMSIDRDNVYGGRARFFWTVGRPFVHDGKGYVPLHKIGGMGTEIINRSQGALLCSDNILSERTPNALRWETLPDGDTGLIAPPGGGSIAEEQSFSVLSDGCFYVIYRSVAGHPVCAYSRDNGHTWTSPRHERYADGRPIKHPRAANFVWKCSNGRYLYWFHNHGGKDFSDRNPAWLCAGRETDSPDGKVIEWSQPEIILYDDDPLIRLSYPDLIEDQGRTFVTETQKDVARVHEIAPELLEDLWTQPDRTTVATEGLILDWKSTRSQPVCELDLPALPDFLAADRACSDGRTRNLRAGITLDICLRFDSLDPGQIILDNRTPNGRGLVMRTADRQAIAIDISDGQTTNTWDCDPDLLIAGRDHHVTVILDGGPRIIMFLIDGRLCDGGDHRQFGWGRFSPNLRTVSASPTIRLAPTLKGRLRQARIYARALRTSEVVGNWRADRGEQRRATT
ncbi:MAG: hypothetical protein HOJ57_11630 [Lentisphaerae bacterium]|nr:hypothetical protein [Lentisphaerota bacterium]